MPERLKNQLTKNVLVLHFSGQNEMRVVTLMANGSWRDCLNRDATIRGFLKNSKWEHAERVFLEGDASSRRYETLTQDSQHMILMDMPQRPDGPSVKDGKPYSAIAHLAENIASVVDVTNQLVSFGYSAPIIESYDLQNGLAIIEDLGDLVYGRLMLSGKDMTEPMKEAVAVLADMATKPWPTNRSSYDMSAQLIEVDLLVSWFWTHVHGSMPTPALHVSFEKIWHKILPLAEAEKPHWVLRDYHSPNLIWIPEREGLKRVGMIDTQDAVLGHPAYDLASMLQDARVDIDFALADDLYQHYVRLRKQQGMFDEGRFNTAYAILGAQRATKILGIFARLAKRDGKPAYLNHMPRVARYLARNLAHPALSELQNWYAENMPEALSVGRK